MVNPWMRSNCKPYQNTRKAPLSGCFYAPPPLKPGGGDHKQGCSGHKENRGAGTRPRHAGNFSAGAGTSGGVFRLSLKVLLHFGLAFDETAAACYNEWGLSPLTFGEKPVILSVLEQIIQNFRTGPHSMQTRRGPQRAGGLSWKKTALV